MTEFNRDSMVALCLAENPQVTIVRAHQCINMNESFVSRIIARYRDTDSVVRRGSRDRSPMWTKKTATSAEMVRKVKKHLDRNPRRSGREMARELNISQDAIRQILKNQLEVKPLKIQKVQDLTDAQKNVRAKELHRLAESSSAEFGFLR